MLNLLPHRRLQVPHGLAIFAALLLIASGIVGYEVNKDAYTSNQETATSARVANTEGEHVVENESRGLKLGLLLFRR